MIAQINHGGFGQIYIGQNVKTKQYVAIKTEIKDKQKFQQIPFEYNIYKHLNLAAPQFKLRHNIDVPVCYDQWQTEQENSIALELLGPNLDQLIDKVGGSFSLQTTCILAKQIISLCELIHKHGIIHSDLKPGQFCIGLNDNKLRLLDFGLSRKFIHQSQHILYEQLSYFTGTYRYSSPNQQMNIQPSRRDDMVSVMYIICYMLTGSLPWQNIKANNQKEKMEKMLKIKMQGSQVLCKMLPPQIKEMFVYIVSLQFQESIDYKFLRDKIVEIQKNYDLLQYEDQQIYDWSNLDINRMQMVQNVGSSQVFGNSELYSIEMEY